MTKVQATKIDCPSCGAPITLRTFTNASRVRCEYCDTLIDQKHTGLSIVEQYDKAQTFKPKIPLGSRGRFEGKTFEVVGFLRREAPEFSWYEYLLFNPYHGYRFLSESNRHWSYVRTLKSEPSKGGGFHPALHHDGRTFKKFASYPAAVSYVFGEFYWQVKVGDRAYVTDYVCPPDLISAERAKDGSAAEIQYSIATYMTPEDVFGRFKLEPPRGTPLGVMANEPNPHAGAWRDIKRLAIAFLAAFVVLTMLYAARTDGGVALRQTLPVKLEPAPPSATPEAGSEAAPTVFTTDSFQLRGGSRNVELTFSCGGLNRNWIAYTGNLINTTTEQAWPFEVEFEYWSGPGWSEGSRSASVVLGAIPDGDYKLVLMPYTGLPTVQARRARGQVTVRRNVMLWRYVVLIFLLLLVVPAFVGFRYAVFESSRWADSDFGGG